MPLAIETGDAKHLFGVVVPDLPGCFSAGGTMDDGKAFPAPTLIEQLQKKRSYRGWTWAVVEVDVSELGDKGARINITMPQRILRAVEAYARKQGETRSGFIARAALDAMRKPD